MQDECVAGTGQCGGMVEPGGAEHGSVPAQAGAGRPPGLPHPGPHPMGHPAAQPAGAAHQPGMQTHELKASKPAGQPACPAIQAEVLHHVEPDQTLVSNWCKACMQCMALVMWVMLD